MSKVDVAGRDDQPTVECRGLTVDYGPIRAVDDMSFAVSRSEVFGLLGPNGAGKTSVIRALTTIIEPTAGDARIAGATLTRPGDIRRRIGVLPESNGYPNSQSALGYLRFYGRLFDLPIDRAEQRATSLLEQVGLGPHSNQRIGTFSRGMRQRLGIARALINDPEVLFLDEPTLGLDPAGKEEILGYLADMASSRGTTVVLCSHLLDEVERTCTRVAIMHEGRLVATGDMAQIAAAAGLTASALVATHPSRVEAAIGALRTDGEVAAAVPTNRPGEIAVRLSGPVESTNGLARTLIANDIPVLSLELRGARLSDAFLTLTGATALEAQA
ncbi:MAG: ABC transporter ATP-binding protein [Acidimicrobiia bacterium]|nr:ABC transporter ATP-binding protein [Acidimicrobiia bacterium]